MRESDALLPSPVPAAGQQIGNGSWPPAPPVEGVGERGHNFRLGALFAFLTAFCTVGMSANSKLAGKAIITPYTSNFVTSVVGASAMAVLVLAQKKSFIPSFEGWRSWFFAYGVAQWFFMWGTFNALRHMDLVNWQSMTACLNQALIMVLAAVVLGESIDMFKIGVLARNALVIALISKPSFVFGGTSTLPLVGLCFLMVQCAGCAVGAAVQRHLCDHPVEPLIFWGFLANVVYWIPPGVSPPGLRVDFLWPATSKDQAQGDMFFSLPGLPYAVATGMFEAFWYVFVGYGLKQMKAANFFFLLYPMVLVLSCIVGALLFHESIDGLTDLAIGIIALGFVVDRWWETRSLKGEGPWFNLGAMLGE